MAPVQLSDDYLLSILWNKAPYQLQKEVGDIKDWSLQKLFEQLLRAEARIAEHDCHVKTEPTKRTQRTLMKDENNIEVQHSIVKISIVKLFSVVGCSWREVAGS